MSHTFLIAFEVEDDRSRSEVRATLYSDLGNLRSAGTTGASWWDAGPDHHDNHDNAEAVFVHHGRALEAGKVLRDAGLTGPENLTLGAHPSVTVIRDGDQPGGHTIAYECDRCDETAESPLALAVVPCADLSLPEHSHYWQEWDEQPNTGAIGVCCVGCDLLLFDGEDDEDWAHRETLVVLDQNGSIIAESYSWVIASLKAKNYGPQASIYDRSVRSMELVGERMVSEWSRD